LITYGSDLCLKQWSMDPDHRGSLVHEFRLETRERSFGPDQVMKISADGKFLFISNGENY
jgi:hypothetical protein